MRTRSGSRMGLLLALSLVAALPPATTAASAPEPGSALDPMAAAADLLGDATSTIAGLGASVTTTLDGVVAAGLGPCGKSGALRMGDDGRLTVLLLGSDYRKRPFIGERMDTIIVATRRPNGRIAMASIPRDTVHFPLASGGTSGTARVNTLYYTYKRKGRFGPTRVDCQALNRFRADVAKALATEIDYYAMVRMWPMEELVDRVGFVTVDVRGPIIDGGYGKRGIFFPDRVDYNLKGRDRCGPRPDKCRSSLVYARSRGGTQAGRTNSDFRRAIRQQDLVFAAAQRVRDRGTGAPLGFLLRGIQDRIYTNVPKTSAAALAIHELLDGIRLAPRDQVVFGPAKWALTNSTTPLYTFRLRLGAVRSWVNVHFGS